MAQSLAHSPPRLPPPCAQELFWPLFFFPGRARGLSPVSFAKTVPCQQSHRDFFSVMVSVRAHGVESLLKARFLLAWRGWGFQPVPQSLSSWADRFSLYCLSLLFLPAFLSPCPHEWCWRSLKSVLSGTAEMQSEGLWTTASSCAFCH